MKNRFLRLLVAAVLTAVILPAQPQRPNRTAVDPEREAEERRADELAEFIKANYTKYEYQIPMRDGAHLFTAVYVPKDFSEPWPIMLNRTPYSVGPYGVNKYKRNLGPSEKFARER